MPISGTMNFQASVTDKRVIQIGSRDIGPALQLNFPFSDGTGAGQGNLAWGQTRVLGGSSEDLDLKTLANYAGTNIDFGSLIGVVFANLATDAELTIKTNITNGCTSFLDGEIKLTRSTSSATSCFTLSLVDATGAVTGPSSKLVRVLGTTGKSYSVIFIGRSA